MIYYRETAATGWRDIFQSEGEDGIQSVVPGLQRSYNYNLEYRDSSVTRFIERDEEEMLLRKGSEDVK